MVITAEKANTATATSSRIRTTNNSVLALGHTSHVPSGWRYALSAQSLQK